MKVDVTGVLHDYNGKPSKRPSEVTDDDGATSTVMVDVTYRDLIVDALNAVRPNEDPPPKDRLTGYRLSILIMDEDVVDLTVEDVGFIKAQVGRYATPLGYGRVCDLLAEPAESGPAANGEAPEGE